MCDFCENILDEDSEDGIDRNHIFVRKDGSYWIFVETGDSFCVGDVANIKFCPYCGRKLSEETGKQSTEELIARLKEKMTEEDYNALQNGIKSFSDGVNALWSVLGKGVETEN